MLGHLAKKVDFLIIGGGMVNAFLGCKTLLPVDGGELKANVETAVVPVTEVPAGKMILDLGPACVKDPADIMLRSSSAADRDVS